MRVTQQQATGWLGFATCDALASFTRIPVPTLLQLTLAVLLVTGCRGPLVNLGTPPDRAELHELLQNELAGADGNAAAAPATPSPQATDAYYAIHFWNGDQEEEWLMRLRVSGDRHIDVSVPKTGDEAEEEDAEEEAEKKIALAEALAAEFGDLATAYADLFVADDLPTDPTWEEEIFVFGEVLGPIRPGGKPKKVWRSVYERKLDRGVFESDFLDAHRDSVRLVESAESLTGAEREESLVTVHEIVICKFKLMLAFATVIGEPQLRKIFRTMLQTPRWYEMVAVAATVAFRSEAGIIRALGKAADLRFDRALNSDDPDHYHFYFRPTFASTRMLNCLVTTTRSSETPYAGAGILKVEGNHPYDSKRRFRVELIDGPTSEFPGAILLSSKSKEFSFSPDSSALCGDEVGEVWLLDDETGTGSSPVATRLHFAGWKDQLRGGRLTPDGRRYISCHGGESLDIVDLTVDPPTVRSVPVEGMALDDGPRCTRDGRYAILENGFASGEVVDLERGEVLEVPPVDIEEAVEASTSDSHGIEWQRVGNQGSLVTIAGRRGSSAPTRVRIPLAVKKAFVDPAGRWLVTYGRSLNGRIDGSWLWDLTSPELTSQE